MSWFTTCWFWSCSDSEVSVKELAKAGKEYFYSTYGDTAEATQAFLRDIYPDLGETFLSSEFQICPLTHLPEFFTTTFAYGYAYQFPQILSGVETSFVMLAANVATDVPKQVSWHLQGAIRNGASLDEVRAIRKISLEVAKASGVVFKNEVPEIWGASNAEWWAERWEYRDPCVFNVGTNSS